MNQPTPTIPFPLPSPGITNRYISEMYRDASFYFMLSNFSAAFAYWVVAQTPKKQRLILEAPLKSFVQDLVVPEFKDTNMPELFSYDRLHRIINEDVFGGIPEILALNETKPDFIDLGALSRNIFYMMLREQITQPL